MNTVEIETLFDNLVPESGPAATLEGEIIRAVSTLGYEYLNNGFYNNISGAANFLLSLRPELDVSHNVNYIKQYTLGEHYPVNGYPELDEIFQDLIDKAVAYVNSKQEYTPNDKDMYDFSDPYPAYEEEDCGDI